MPRIDYFAIEQGIQTILQADAALAALGARVVIEEELPFLAETGPWVGIYLERREAPRDLQALAGGQQTRFLVRLTIWCSQFSLKSIAEAIHLRDDLVGKVEIALMSDRRLNGTVSTSWLDGGDLPSAKNADAGGWLSRGEVLLVADVKATTT